MNNGYTGNSAYRGNKNGNPYGGEGSNTNGNNEGPVVNQENPGSATASNSQVEHYAGSHAESYVVDQPSSGLVKDADNQPAASHKNS